MPSFPANPRLVVMPLYPGVMLLDVAGPAQVFETAAAAAAERGEGRAYRLAFVSLAGGPIATDTGLILHSEVWGPEQAKADTLLVPGGSGAWQAAEDALMLARVRRAASAARRTVAVCLGAFVLAAAGLLDGRRAVTH